MLVYQVSRVNGWVGRTLQPRQRKFISYNPDSTLMFLFAIGIEISVSEQAHYCLSSAAELSMALVYWQENNTKANLQTYNSHPHML